MKRRAFLILFPTVCLLFLAFVFRPQVFPGGETLYMHLRGKKTINDRMQEFGISSRSRLSPYFEKAGVLYPPQKIIFVGLKAEKRLDVYASGDDGKMKFIREYKVLAASGKAGPKLREGDLQVPEGFYRIESLNPNSAFHLALRVNYPNDFDRQNAKRENRSDLGGDIMIHGSNASVGCLAMGDSVAEELFVLSADTGIENLEVLLCPGDFRVKKIRPSQNSPQWTSQLYRDLAASLRRLPRPNLP